ncbi:MAG: hypothetical protein A3A86_05965 [Elusimicrobia bacterium RIFCSPLOWO2_01_FULL_60_11]|nr:MAG: hypothetical protein A3A86_05965 [Elusimicrobia bacterium RIFCSPLOWO2_01_FULL_60_11]
MICQVSGTVTAVEDYSLTLEVGALAYEIFVPTSVVAHYRRKTNGSAPKEPETFHTIQYIEGASGHGNQFMRLVGFKRKVEKEFFQLYTGVEGVGYKTALKSLVLPIQKIALAIERNDLATLKKLPHIGTRTAEKMVATLKGRMQKFALDLSDEPLTAGPEADISSEALQVLRQVGYGDAESSDLIHQALSGNAKIKSSEEMIREIFRMKNAAGSPAER